MSGREHLISIAVDEILITPEYPSKVEVRKKKNFSLVMKLINKSLHFGVFALTEKLKLMGYSDELAGRTAINIVGKVNIFFNWQMLTQNIEYWLPEGFAEASENMSEAEIEGVLLQIAAINDVIIGPAYTAYLSDEKLDDPMQLSDQNGGYAETAIGKMLDEAEEVLAAIDPEDPASLEEYKDQFKAKLVDIVDLFLYRNKNREEDLLEKPEELFAELDKYNLGGMYHMYEFAGLLAKALIGNKKKWNKTSTPGNRLASFKTDAKAHIKGIFTEKKIRFSLYEAVLGLADVLNYELISALAAKRVRNGEIDKKTPLPYTFVIAMAMLSMGEKYGGPGLSMDTAGGAYTTGLVESQGLVMVANILYLRQGFTLRYNKETKRVTFVKDNTKKLRSFKELLSSKNSKLHIFIEICQFLVRLSDDIGDKDNDEKTLSPNLLLLLEMLRSRFLDGKEPEVLQEGEGSEDAFNPEPTQKIHLADLIGLEEEEDPRATQEVMATTEGDIDDDTQDIDTEAMADALSPAEEVEMRRRQKEREQRKGYLGRLSEKSGIDLVGLMNEAYVEFDKGSVSRDRIHYWVARLLDVLDKARKFLDADNTDVLAGTKSYKSYADCLKTIAEGAIKIGTRFNDEDITEEIQKENIAKAS
jgi:hypothetical protein